MSDDWETAADEDDIPVDKWAGEDAEEEAPESWDIDEEEEAKKKAAVAAANAPPKPSGPVLSKRKKQLIEEKAQAEKEKAVTIHDTLLYSTVSHIHVHIIYIPSYFCRPSVFPVHPASFPLCPPLLVSLSPRCCV